MDGGQKDPVMLNSFQHLTGKTLKQVQDDGNWSIDSNSSFLIFNS